MFVLLFVFVLVVPTLCLRKHAPAPPDMCAVLCRYLDAPSADVRATLASVLLPDNSVLSYRLLVQWIGSVTFLPHMVSIHLRPAATAEFAAEYANAKRILRQITQIRFGKVTKRNARVGNECMKQLRCHRY
jgi:hypothetical protein